MAGEGLYFVEAIFLCFIVFTFDLHMYCDDMLINWNRLVCYFFGGVLFKPALPPPLKW